MKIKKWFPIYHQYSKLFQIPQESHKEQAERDHSTGSPRGNYRKFGLNRRTFRKMALQGLLPGVTKASW